MNRIFRNIIEIVALLILLVALVKCDKDVTTTPPDTEPENNSLYVTSNPNGYDIYINDRISGKITPSRIDYLESGDYSVDLVHPVFLDTTITVTLGNEETESIDIDFTQYGRFYSTLECTSTPSSAEIVLDDSATGVFTPGVLTGVFPGDHKLSLKKLGYRSKELNLSLLSDDNFSAHINLEDTTIWLVYNTDNSDLPSNSLSSLALNPQMQDHLLVGLDDMGVVEISSSSWNNLNSGNSILPSNFVTDVGYVDSNFKVYSTYEGIVFNQNGGLTLYTSEHPNIGSHRVEDMSLLPREYSFGRLVSDEKVYFATDAGVLMYSDGRFSEDQFLNSRLPSQAVTAIKVYEWFNSRFFIVGTRDHGIYAFNSIGDNPVDQVFNQNNAGFISNRVTAVDFTPGWYYLYVGVKISATMGDPVGMLYFYDHSGVWQEINLNYSVINDIKINFEETWVATNNGLYKIEFYTQITQHWDTSNSPLPSNNVYDVEVDLAGNVWVATGKGLVRFQPD